MKALKVSSTVIDWPDQIMEITDTDGSKHTIPLDKTITVTMIGYPDREQKTMQAHQLDPYMMRGYIIEQIEYEEASA